MSELLFLFEGEVAGRVQADKSGRLALDYDASWRESPRAHSLSVSMLLARITYPHRIVQPYLWNLLPENPNVLQRWAQQYHVSAGNPFKLLMYVGADVPGAAQFIPPDRLKEYQSQSQPIIQWMSIDELSERLRQLSDDFSAVRRPNDLGKMSLPGAQAKTAYYWDRAPNRWGVPAGRTPTTHIIKPCIPGFDGLVENEHLCLDIASRLGMPAAHSFVLMLDRPYIVLERYDRLVQRDDSALPERIHQEDMCQALGLMPTGKYQEDGGPGIAQITSLIRRVSSDPEGDVVRFLRANVFNWLIGGTDVHAKNYSFLIDAQDVIRLAPLYDLSSQLPYPDLIAQRVAMKIGAHYEIALVDVADWRRVARDCSMDEDHVLTLVADMAKALPEAVSSAQTKALTDGLDNQVVTVLADHLIRHARERLFSLTGTRR